MNIKITKEKKDGKRWKMRRGARTQWWWHATWGGTRLTILKISGVCRHL